MYDADGRMPNWSQAWEGKGSRESQELVDYLKKSVLTEFQSFVASGKQYKDDSVYAGRAMDEFYERTEHLRGSMEVFVDL